MGEHVVIRNCKIRVFRRHMRVEVDRWGKISACPDGIESTPPPPPSVNVSNNISETEYLVKVLDSGEGDSLSDSM